MIPDVRINKPLFYWTSSLVHQLFVHDFTNKIEWIVESSTVRMNHFRIVLQPSGYLFSRIKLEHLFECLETRVNSSTSIGTKRLLSTTTTTSCTDMDDDLLANSSTVSFFKDKQTKELSVELQEKGYVRMTTQLLKKSTCYELKKRMTKMFDGEFETGIYPDEWHWRQGLSKDNVTREICNAWKSDTYIASIVLHPSLGQFICHLMGWNSIRIAQDDILWKPPRTTSSSVGFHQDSTYISKQFEPYDNNSVTLWIALDDATIETGCLEYIPKSHTQEWNKQYNNNNNIPSTSFHNTDIMSDLYQHSQCVPVKEGYALLHHQDVWHGSKPNQSNHQHRRALVIHYLRGDVKFSTTNDITYIYGRYKRHSSIDLDEQFFPIIYGNRKLTRSSWLNDFLNSR